MENTKYDVMRHQDTREWWTQASERISCRKATNCRLGTTNLGFEIA